jgi:integral membrane protein
MVETDVDWRKSDGWLGWIMKWIQSPVGRLRVIGFLEGLSFLVLLGIAMPLKYLADEPGAVRVVGMAHGVLFLLYVAAVIQAALEYGWRLKITALLLIASLLPFGPFVADAKLLKKMPADV